MLGHSFDIHNIISADDNAVFLVLMIKTSSCLDDKDWQTFVSDKKHRNRVQLCVFQFNRVIPFCDTQCETVGLNRNPEPQNHF